MRPILRVTLRSSTNEEQCDAIVDSGADYCLFPLNLSDKLGLRVEDSLRVPGIVGYGSSYDSDKAEDVPFWQVELAIAPGLSISTIVGFTDRQDGVGFGILGQLGFFSKVAQVSFDYKAGRFAIMAVNPDAVL